MASIRIAFLVALIAYAQVQFIAADDLTTDDTLSTENPSSDRSFSIESSNVEDPQYEWDAIKCLTEAYVINPTSFDIVVEDFAKLYKLQHSGNWNVNAGCSSLYIPKAKIIIVIKVTEGADTFFITLYD
ncbi:uncharacterized protein LOC108904246 [Anoplophora glabripennis]|uniref:uncharacterized protein LOC108904246 n=1 Tax=Anoplophora glabripennis TaxID=217634 RepID=UPI0008744475|nr:uncharacterized protein LOC108904246 [Anoplophora glabripennis]